MEIAEHYAKVIIDTLKQARDAGVSEEKLLTAVLNQFADKIKKRTYSNKEVVDLLVELFACGYKFKSSEDFRDWLNKNLKTGKE
jgi:hypothetical protein